MPFLVQVIRSGKDEGDLIRRVPRDDAQIFIDAIDKVRFTFAFHPRDLWAEIHFGLFHQIGTGHAQYFAENTEKMSQSTLQDVWPPRTPSECDADPRVI